MDYGTIAVPVGAKVFRYTFSNGKVSDWFLDDEDFVKLCPKEYIYDGKPSDFFIHDATFYGITLPNANVKKDSGTPSEKHLAHHY